MQGVEAAQLVLDRERRGILDQTLVDLDDRALIAITIVASEPP